MEERGVCNAEAWGSNPHGSTGVRDFRCTRDGDMPGKGLRPRETGAMIRCVKEQQIRRYRTLHGFDGTRTFNTPVSGWLGSGADEGRAKLR